MVIRQSIRQSSGYSLLENPVNEGMEPEASGQPDKPGDLATSTTVDALKIPAISNFRGGLLFLPQTPKTRTMKSNPAPIAAIDRELQLWVSYV
jgi:hypothetical protein